MTKNSSTGTSNSSRPLYKEKPSKFLGKRTRDDDYYEEESNLSFVVDDDQDGQEYDPLETGDFREMLNKMFRRNRYTYADDDYSSSDMEARYDEIEAEERRAAKIAAREDAE